MVEENDQLMDAFSPITENMIQIRSSIIATHNYFNILQYKSRGYFPLLYLLFISNSFHSSKPATCDTRALYRCSNSRYLVSSILSGPIGGH